MGHFISEVCSERRDPWTIVVILRADDVIVKKDRVS